MHFKGRNFYFFFLLERDAAASHLIENHANLTIKNNDGYDALSFAIKQGKLSKNNFDFICLSQR